MRVRAKKHESEKVNALELNENTSLSRPAQPKRKRSLGEGGRPLPRFYLIGRGKGRKRRTLGGESQEGRGRPFSGGGGKDRVCYGKKSF